MKYLGKITDNKDLVTKEYVDTAVGNKQNKLTAGDGISISPDNVISITAPRVYSGADAPANTLGNNGDIYIQIPEA